MAARDPDQPLKKTTHWPPKTGNNVQRLSKVTATMLGVIVFILIVGFLTERLFLSSIVVNQGKSFGFEIGQTRQAAFETASNLIAKGNAEAIHVWPDGETHRPFRENENPLVDQSSNWKIVVDKDWWNNSVVLTFRDGHVIQIRRTRVIWEMP